MRLISIQCPEYNSAHIRKNGKNKGKQNHICVDCGRQFIDRYETPKGYSDVCPPQPKVLDREGAISS